MCTRWPLIDLAEEGARSCHCVLPAAAVCKQPTLQVGWQRKRLCAEPPALHLPGRYTASLRASRRHHGVDYGMHPCLCQVQAGVFVVDFSAVHQLLLLPVELVVEHKWALEQGEAFFGRLFRPLLTLL